MRRRVVALAVLALVAAGCQRPSKPAGGARYPLRGKAVSVDPARRVLTVAHGDIPGFMPAMTMEFAVLEKDQPLLADIRPGDEVSATLVVPDSRYWLEDLVVVRRGAGGAKAGPSVPQEARLGEPLPEVSLVDQDGRALALRDLHGRAIALTFVFTRCPLPDYCPLMMKNFASAESALLADPALRDRTRLLTVSFDTKHDTPEVLRAFGRPFQKTTPPFTHWMLATGSEQAIRTLGAALELDYVEESASFTHNLRTAVVSPEGKLARLFRGNEWKPADLVEALRAAVR